MQLARRADHAETKVRKIEKPPTPFSYRRSAVEVFDRLFRLYRESIIVLSYSSNVFPDRETLEGLLRCYKKTVTAYERPHRYHFGTHRAVERASVHEYLIVDSEWKLLRRSLTTLSTACDR